MKKVFSTLFIIILLILTFGCNQNIESHVHNFSDVWSYDESFHWHDASCEHTEVVKDKAEHNFGEYKANNDATTETDGTKSRFCTVCKYEEKVIDEGSKIHVHSWDEGVITTPSDCTTECVITYTCKLCGYSYSESKEISNTDNSIKELNTDHFYYNFGDDGFLYVSVPDVIEPDCINYKIEIFLQDILWVGNGTNIWYWGYRLPCTEKIESSIEDESWYRVNPGKYLSGGPYLCVAVITDILRNEKYVYSNSSGILYEIENSRWFDATIEQSILIDIESELKLFLFDFSYGYLLYEDDSYVKMYSYDSENITIVCKGRTNIAGYEINKYGLALRPDSDPERESYIEIISKAPIKTMSFDYRNYGAHNSKNTSYSFNINADDGSNTTVEFEYTDCTKYVLPVEKAGRKSYKIVPISGRIVIDNICITTE